MDYTSKILLMRSPGSHSGVKGGRLIIGRECPNMGLPAATIATSVNKKGKESWLLKNSLPCSMPKEKRKVMDRKEGASSLKTVQRRQPLWK